MKTDLFLKLGSTTVALLLGTLAAAYAGPSPHWITSSATTPAAKSAVTAAAKCEGCKTTTNWVSSSRAPSRGVPIWSAAGTKHECKICAGNIVNDKGKATDTMVHNQACAPLTCCK